MSETKKAIDKLSDNKNKYRQCSWWRFKKRRELYGKWQSALDLAAKHS